MSGDRTTPLQRCVAELMRQKPLKDSDIQALTLRDLPAGENRNAVLRDRFAAGLSLCPNSRVLVY
jgi:hypothetical protein